MFRLYVHRICNRLAKIAVNHFNQPYKVTDRLWPLSESTVTFASIETLSESPRVCRLCVYDVVKTAIPTSTTTSDTLAIGGTIFMTFGSGGLPSLDCFVK